jgi:hypothetical protein
VKVHFNLFCFVLFYFLKEQILICGDMFVPKYDIGKFLEFVYTYEFDSLAPKKIYHKDSSNFLFSH